MTVNVDYTSPRQTLEGFGASVSAGAFTITVPAKSVVTVVG
ncbi:MAG TPA: hypothetical protein VJ875_23330 [Pyrinomonadaceae bacterium]|nr:hypothetical protein [Pyrinomonadaceae bacterium]